MARADMLIVRFTRAAPDFPVLTTLPFFMRSTFEDTRRKALKFRAYGTTVKAFKP